MPLTDAQKTNLRRHLDVPVAGRSLQSTAAGTLANANAGYRYLDAWGQLEYRMNQLNPDEESRLLGQPAGLVGIAGVNTITIGTTFQLQISGGGLGSPVTVSYTSVAGDTFLTVLTNLAGAINQNATLVAAGFYAFNPWTFQSANSIVPLPTMGIENTTAGVASFTLTVLSSTNPMLTALQQGLLLPPYAVTDDSTIPVTTVYGYLPICDALEAAIFGATNNLDTSRADVWYPRMDEPEVRTKLYRQACQHMADFLFGKGAWRGPMGAPSLGYRSRI